MPIPTRLRVLAAAVLVAAVGGAAVLSVTDGGDPPPIVDAPAPTAPEKVPYDPAALINRSLPDGGPTDPRSDAVIDLLVRNTERTRVQIATGGETPPIYLVRPSDPFLDVYVDGRRIRFRVPARAVPGGGADHPLVLLDRNHPDFGRFVELRLFQAWINREDGEVYASGASLGHYNNDGRRLNPDGSRSTGVPFLGGGTGSGLSIMTGLIRPEEIEAGRITHAIRFAYSGIDSTTGFRPPAVKTDQPKNGFTREPGGAMQMGMRLQLDPGVDCDRRTVPGAGSRSRETRFLRIVCRALQTHGMVMLDGSSDGTLLLQMEGAETGRWEQVIGEMHEGGYGYIVRDARSARDGLGRDALSGIPWRQLRVVAPEG